MAIRRRWLMAIRTPGGLLDRLVLVNLVETVHVADELGRNRARQNNLATGIELDAAIVAGPPRQHLGDARRAHLPTPRLRRLKAGRQVQVRAIHRVDAVSPHQCPSLDRCTHVQLVRRRHRLSVHFDEEAVTVESTDPLIDDLEAVLPRIGNELTHGLFRGLVVTFLHDLDNFVEWDEAVLVYVEPEFIRAMA